MSRSRITTYISPLTSTSARSSGSKRTRSSTCTERTREPMPTTRHHESRLPPSAAFAGMRMPPVEVRSPGSRSRATSTRSCSIRMGVFSPAGGWDSAAVARLVTGVRSVHDLADQSEHDHDGRDAARHLEDVVPARCSVGRHEVALHLVDLAPGNRLGAGPVDELVDRRGQPLPGHLDVGLDQVQVPAVAHAHTPRRSLLRGNVTVSPMSERSE